MTFAEFMLVVIGWGIFPVFLWIVTFRDRVRQRALLGGIARGLSRGAVLKRCARFGVRAVETAPARLVLWSTASCGFFSTSGSFAEVAFDQYDRVLYAG